MFAVEAAIVRLSAEPLYSSTRTVELVNPLHVTVYVCPVHQVTPEAVGYVTSLMGISTNARVALLCELADGEAATTSASRPFCRTVCATTCPQDHAILSALSGTAALAGSSITMPLIHFTPGLMSSRHTVFCSAVRFDIATAWSAAPKAADHPNWTATHPYRAAHGIVPTPVQIPATHPTLASAATSFTGFDTKFASVLRAVPAAKVATVSAASRSCWAVGVGTRLPPASLFISAGLISAVFRVAPRFSECAASVINRPGVFLTWIRQ